MLRISHKLLSWVKNKIRSKKIKNRGRIQAQVGKDKTEKSGVRHRISHAVKLEKYFFCEKNLIPHQNHERYTKVEKLEIVSLSLEEGQKVKELLNSRKSLNYPTPFIFLCFLQRPLNI